MVCILQYLAAPVGTLFILLLIDAGKWIWLFYIIGEVLTFIVAMLLKGKDKCAGRLDWETLIKKSDDTSAAIDMLKQTLSDNSVTDAKMQLVSKVLNNVAEIFSDADSQQAELNLRAYETDGVLKCSVETDLVDADGKLSKIAQDEKDNLYFSNVFGLKRIILEGLKNDG